MYLSKLLSVVFIASLLSACSGFDPTEVTESQGPQKYIVVFKKDTLQARSSGGVAAMAASLANRHEIPSALKVYSVALQGGLYELDEDQALALAKDSRVAYVEKDQIYRINDVQNGATWGLDRIDQPNLPLNQSYSYDPSGTPVNAYVIDTGINLSHREFQGRATSGFDFASDDSDASDCNGHGTHVAGTIGGSTYGVAKNARLIAVRVLDCNGSGSLSDVIAGIEWVTQNHQKPAVANMSLGGGISQAIDDAVNASIAAGVTYVVAAGNESTNACNGSPSRVPLAITVGSTTKTDARSSFSNFGSCVDIFAPGSDITSAWIGSNSATDTISGTSMASPHVAGAAAVYLSQHPQALPAEVANALNSNAIQGKVTNPGSGSPNKLLQVSAGNNPNPKPDEPTQPQEPPQRKISGDLKATRDFVNTPEYNAAPGFHKLKLSGPAGADFDLYLYRKSGSTWIQVARAISSSSTEAINYQGAAGVYRVKVLSYSGAGRFNLTLETP